MAFSPLTKIASSFLSEFSRKASPEEMLKLATLVKEAREMEQRAELAKDVIAANRDSALRVMQLREDVLKTVIARRLDRTDRAIDILIAKLENAKSPHELAPIAEAIATVTTTDNFSDLAEIVKEIKSDKVDLQF